MKLIDKDAVVAEIERRKHKLLDNIMFEHDKEWVVRTAHQLNRIIMFLDTLEVKEVDLEKTLIGFQNRYAYENNGELPSAIEIAKHFFELGLKSKSPYVGIPNIDDTLKEMGVDPDSKEANTFKESFYNALEKFKAQKGE